MRPPARGRFLTFEGIEGSGKSTQAERLCRKLANSGHRLLLTREPGGTPFGGKLRELLLAPGSEGLSAEAELLLYSADRAEHRLKVIEPALAAGTLVLCDRHSDATYAYQGYGRGLPLDLIERVNIGDLAPDLTLLFDLPAEQGLSLARGRNLRQGLFDESRFESLDLAFHQRVRDGYLELARKSPARFRVIDAGRSADQVFEVVWSAAKEVLDG